ncbi:MAG: ComF family protein [candidate division Zixibacteria bacterium]
MIEGILRRSDFFLKSIYDDFKEFLSPSLCIGCRSEISRDNPFFCDNCFRSLKRENSGTGPICPFCGRPEGVSGSCSFCVDTESSLLYFWGGYDSLLKESVTLFKFNGMVELGKSLTEMAANNLASRLESLQFDMIVPVPLYKTRRRQRGFNQSEIIAEILAKRLGTPLRPDLLKRVRQTAQQAKLEENQRWKNVEAAFALREIVDLSAKRILLVDDIVTTGATIFEASRPLKDSGASHVTIFSLAYAS